MSTNASSYATTKTTAATAVRKKWEAGVLKTASHRAIAAKFAKGRVVGRGEGGTLYINRILRPSKVTTALTEGYLYGYADAKALTTNYISVTPSKWGDHFGFTSESDWDTLLQDDDLKDVIANQMAQSTDYQIMKTMATGCLRHRIDKDGTYQKSGTVTTADSAGTSLISTALTEADDAWNGGYATITSPDGGCYDETSAVTDFATTGDTAKVSFSNGLTLASDFRITVGAGIAATDVLTVTGLLDVSALHRKLQTDKFEGGVFRGFLDAAQERDLWTDSTFLGSATYDSNQKFKNYKLMRWFDMEFFIADGIYREDENGTENQATGVCYVTPIFGDNSYTVVKWDSGQGDMATKFTYVDKPDSGNLGGDMRWISWRGRFGSKVTRATSIIGLMTGATSLNVVSW